MSFATLSRRFLHSLHFYSFLLVLLLVGTSNEVLSYGWLDKLTGQLGSGDDQQQSLSTDDIGGGLKEALRVGTQTVVENLGKDPVKRTTQLLKRVFGS